MNQEVQKFIDLLKTDKAVQEKMKTATAKYMSEQELAAFQNVVSPVAEEAGYHFTWEEYQEYMKQKVMELDQDEMDQVAGGLGGFPCMLFANIDPACGFSAAIPIGKN